MRALRSPLAQPLVPNQSANLPEVDIPPPIISLSSNAVPEPKIGFDWLGRLGGVRYGGATGFMFEHLALLPGRKLIHGFFTLVQTPFAQRPLPLQWQL